MKAPKGISLACLLGLLACLLGGCAVSPRAVVIRTNDALGTGWVCDQEGAHIGDIVLQPGEILTVRHVVGDAETVLIPTTHGWVEARVECVGLGWAIVRPIHNEIVKGDSGSAVFKLVHAGAVEAIFRD